MANFDLTRDQLNEFVRTGLLVIPDVLTSDEVAAARTAFHAQLREHGVDHDALLDGEQSPDALGVRMKSPAASFYARRWRLLEVSLAAQVVRCARQLIMATFGGRDAEIARETDESGAPLFGHPLGAFDDVVFLCDRTNYRLPDSVRAEGGLEMHIDRNAVDPFANLAFWRPVQAFVALTDQYGGESGGLRCVRGFHARYNSYDVARGEDPSALAKGAFNRLNTKRHSSLADACMPVDCPAGALVLWDNRLPHATAQKLRGRDTREVVYCNFVPNVPVNAEAVAAQRRALELNLQPPHYDTTGAAPGDRDWQFDELTDEQRRLLGVSENA